MGTIYTLTLRQLAGRARLVIMAVLVTMPVLVALIMVGSDSAPPVAEFERIVLGGILAGSIIPLVVLATGAVAFANEIEDRTLANLTLTPLPRWQIVLPKVLATITVAAPLILVSTALTSWIAFLGDVQAVAAVTAAAAIAVALYATAFTWLGLVTTQAIAAGLLYIVLWEGLVAGYVTGARLLSIRYHAIALMHGFDPRRFAGDVQPGLALALTLTALVGGAFLFLAVRRLRRMDVP